MKLFGCAALVLALIAATATATNTHELGAPAERQDPESVDRDEGREDTDDERIELEAVLSQLRSQGERAEQGDTDDAAALKKLQEIISKAEKDEEETETDTERDDESAQKDREQLEEQAVDDFDAAEREEEGSLARDDEQEEEAEDEEAGEGREGVENDADLEEQEEDIEDRTEDAEQQEGLEGESDAATGNEMAARWGIFNRCKKRPCKNGARCKNYVLYYKCYCRPGYYGRNCQYACNRYCRNGGTCYAYGTRNRSFKCRCKSPYYGSRCQYKRSCFCKKYPCLNGGTCYRKGNRCYCRCRKGYTGYRCQSKVCWIKHSRSRRSGGLRRTVSSLSRCKYECRRKSGCTGVQYRPKSWLLPRRCYLHGSWSGPRRFSLSYSYYERIC